jgi:DNA repair photolyase
VADVSEKAPLVGIARLAAEGPLLEAKRRVEYFELTTRKLLAKCDSPRMPFRWMINPYRGCEFGCKYCYARYTHEFMELRQADDFERKIFAKHFDRKAFLADLRRLPRGEWIAIGSATDPYQPAERRFGLTRSILNVFAETSGLRVSLITKSDLIARDVDIFQEIARRHQLTITLTITTLDAELARLLEPLAPRPDLRIEALRTLAAAGLRVTVNCCPVMPLINDSEDSIDAVARAAAEAGAIGIGANVVYLKPCALNVFLPFLDEQFPHLSRKYRERFERTAYLNGAYPEMIRERLHRIRARYGLEKRIGPEEPRPPEKEPPAQMALFSSIE